MAIYLEDMSVGEKGRLNKFSAGATASRAGEANFLDQRSTFHRGNLAGVPGFFPPLRSGANAQQEGPTTFVRLILEGVRSVLTEVKPTPTQCRPSPGSSLTERSRRSRPISTARGNKAPSVSASKLASLWGAVHANAE